MNVKLIAHTALSQDFLDSLPPADWHGKANERAVVALTAIRTCYSANKPSDIAYLEGAKYFGTAATDGEDGTDADRLFRHIIRSGHTSTCEHITYTFAVEGVSRSLLAQLTRHRQFSFSVQSQRYVKFGSGDRSGGFDYVTPPSLEGKSAQPDRMTVAREVSAETLLGEAMEQAQYYYDRLRDAGVPAEDARFVLPNAAACNLVMTGNLRAYLEFYGKRKRGNGAQWEIADLSERIKAEITKVDAWTNRFFDEA